MAAMDRCNNLFFGVGYTNAVAMQFFLFFFLLSSLRRNRRANEYMNPNGDWFAHVSCPHYLAEIIIYLGISVAGGGSDVTIWFLFLFVVSNLVIAAAEIHRWYRKKFDDYPKD